MKSILFAIVVSAVWTGTGAERTAVPLGKVRVGGVIGERIAMTVTNNLMKLDYDRDFIRQFVAKDGKKSFVGTGNVIESLVALARYTGDGKVLALKRRLVDAIVAAQTPEGYIGCMPPEKRVWHRWDVEDIGFILDGLVLDWKLFGEKRSLDAAVRAADQTLANWKDPPKDFDRIVYDKETLMGLAHGMWSLFAVTGDRRYADFVSDTMGYGTCDEPVRLGRDLGLRGQIDGYLDTCLTQLDMYGRTGDPRLLRQFNRFLRHFLHENGALIHGIEGICECFTGDQDGSGYAGETCMSAYLLCTLDAAIRVGAMDASLAGDLMERTLYNAFFAAQSRDGRRLRYYTPVVGERPYWPMDDYCCPCNYRRVIGHLPEFVFYASGEELLANLYTEAEAELAVAGTTVRVKETTDYPTTGSVEFRVDPAEERDFSFALRLPRWCAAPSVSVNGEPLAGLRPGALQRIRRTWKAGDVVRAEFPMPVRLVRGRARQQGRFAVMRGPLVYAIDTKPLAMERGTWAEGQGNDAATAEDVMVVYPETLRAILGDAAARRNGTAVLASASLVPYQLGKDCGFASPREVRLTEFADPANTLTYFRVPDPAGCGAVDDELFSPCDGRQFTYDDKLMKIFHPLVKEPVRFTVIADAHFALHDERDAAREDNLARTAQWPGREADLDAAFAAARKFGADIVPLAGDMFSFPSFANIEFLDRKMRESGLDCRYISGNHDWHFEGLPGSDDELRATWIRRMACLYRGEDPMAYSVVKKGVRFVFIDDTTYRITPAQLAFFKRELATGDPVVLVMHVPFWMAPRGDTDTLANPHWGYETDVNYVPERRERWPREGQPRESFELAELAFSAPNTVAVFAGHEHALQVASRHGVPQVIVPKNFESGAYVNVEVSNK